METKGIHTGFWWLNMKRRYSSQVSCINVRIILKWMLENEDSMIWTGYIWLRMEMYVGLL